MARSKFFIDEENVLDQEAPIGSSEPEKPKKVTPAKTVKPSPEKKKVGRPKVKTEPTKTINIAVPISVLEQVEIALAKYQGNLTEYINAIILNDLNVNFDNYQTIYNILNN